LSATLSSAPGIGRPALVALVLVAEMLHLSLLVESPDAGSGLLAAALAQLPVLGKVAIVAAGALLLLLSPRAADLGRLLQPADARPVWRLWLVANLVAYAALVSHTVSMFGAQRAGDPASASDLAAWLALATLVVGTWALAVAPGERWLAFARREWPALLVALGAGALTFGASLLAQSYWRPLARGTLDLAYRMLRPFYPQVEREPVSGMIGTPKLIVEIAPSCSGYEGIALITVFTAVYLWLFRGRLRFPHALLLLPVGIVTIWLANAVRIAALVAVGTSISPAIAVQGFHSQAGWIAFTTIALGMIFVAHKLLRLPEAEPAGQPVVVDTVRHPPDSAPALLVPQLVLLGMSVIAAAFSAGFAFLYPLAILAAVAALISYREHYRALTWTVSPAAVGIGIAVFAMWMALEPAPAAGDGDLGARLASLPFWIAALWLACRLVGSVLLVPVVEELAFRGYLLRKLVSADFASVSPRHFTWLSFIGSSILFGLMHDRWLAGTLAGAMFAGAVYLRGRLSDAIVAHAVANGLIAGAVLGFGQWQLW
jgi:exosortase E/protease (VPEID-CTERM system)